jgi:hypothetical protein
MTNMAEILDDDSILFSSGTAPEMLDYAFVDTCESTNELRAVLKALESGEWGLYPDLENHTREKLIGMLPDQTKIIATRPSPSVMAEESENLHTWVEDLASESDASVPCNSGAAKLKKPKDIPVRDVKCTAIINADVLSDVKRTTPVRKKIATKPLSKVMMLELIYLSHVIKHRSGIDIF